MTEKPPIKVKVSLQWLIDNTLITLVNIEELTEVKNVKAVLSNIYNEVFKRIDKLDDHSSEDTNDGTVVMVS